MNTMNQPTPPPDKPQGAETIAETPRTDDHLDRIIADRLTSHRTWCETPFTRQLESELVAATEALEKAKAELVEWRRAKAYADLVRHNNNAAIPVLPPITPGGKSISLINDY